MGGHLSWPALARRLERCTRFLGGPRRRNLLHLAPDGVWRAAVSPRRWWALTPPFHPCRPRSRPAVSFLCHFPSAFAAWDFPSVLPCGVRTFLGPEARGHPACDPDCSPAPLPAWLRATVIPHSGQQISPRRCSTNSPQTRHSRLAPRSSAKSSCSSVRFKGATVTASGTPPRRDRGSGRGARRSDRAPRSRAGGGSARSRGSSA